MKKLTKKGFAHVEVFILVIMIALVSGVGYYVWQRSSNNNPDSSAASNSVNPVPVYEIFYYYPGTKIVNQVDYVVGNSNLKRAVDKGQGNVKNNRVAFMAFPNDKRVKGAKTVWKVAIDGGSKRTDVGSLNHSGVKTVIMSTDASLNKKLKNDLGFSAQNANIKMLEEKNPFYSRVEPTKRLWNVVTKDKRREYRYSSNETVVKNWRSDNGYTADSGALYGPQVGRYCKLTKTKNYGKLCKVKSYRLPDFEKFERYIEQSEAAKKNASVSYGSGFSSGTVSQTPPSSGVNTGPPNPQFSDPDIDADKYLYDQCRKQNKPINICLQYLK